jgi:hypothetical protein
MATMIGACGCAAGKDDEGTPTGAGIHVDAGDDTSDFGDTGVFDNIDAAEVGGDGSTACVAKEVTAEQVPLDMLILLDTSSSMLDPTITPQKWSTVVSALTKFFDDPASKGISVALTMFPNGSSCSAAAYQSPQIDYGLLPGNEPALVKAMTDTNPATHDLTPLHSVAQGALAGAIDWKKSHVGHTVLAVLATDGKSTCITSFDPAASAANALTQGIQTFTIGMAGADLSQLNGIAAAGGTTKAYDATNIALFSKHMEEIRSIALPCEVVIPPPPDGETLERDKVNVQYTPGGTGTAETIPYAGSAAGCGTTGGWYYDNDVAPTKIVYCPTTCKTVQGDTHASIKVAFGCKSILK